MRMKKTSTLVYSIHNLASKANNEIQDADDLDSRNEFAEVYNILEKIELYDVQQDVVDRILKYADSL